MNDRSEYFDDDLIGAIIERADQFPSAKALNDKLIEEVDQFRGTMSYPDDIAVLTCKYKVG
jgi:hypothetical protein